MNNAVRVILKNMKTLKNHEKPLFEVIVNKESNKKFFAESGDITETKKGSFHVESWSMGW